MGGGTWGEGAAGGGSRLGDDQPALARGAAKLMRRPMILRRSGITPIAAPGMASVPQTDDDRMRRSWRGPNRKPRLCCATPWTATAAPATIAAAPEVTPKLWR